MTTPLEVVTYRRVSTDNQAENFSLPTQGKACLKYARDNDWIVRKEFEDDGWSGENVDRPALDELRYLLETCNIHAVIIYDVDRLSRRLIDLLTLDEEFRRRGVEMIFVQYPVDPSPEGFLFLQMRGAFAEYERHKIEERMKRGRVARARAGIPAWGDKLPYGYRYVSEAPRQGHWELHQEETSAVRTIFRWLVEEGMSINGIANRLNSEEIYTPRGVRWHKHTVYRILKNEAYTGVAHWGKTYRVEPAKRLNKHPKIKKSVVRYKDPSEWIPLSVPAIIDTATFNAAKKRLEANKRRSAPKRSRDYILTGRIRCICGKAMCGDTTKNSDGKKYFYYACSTMYLPPEDRCRLGVLRAEEAEAAVWNRITDVLDTPEIIAEELADKHKHQMKQREHFSFDLDVKRTVLKDLERKRRQWDRAYENDAIDLEDYKDKLGSLRNQEGQLLADIEEHERRVQVLDADAETLMSMREAVGRVREKLGNADNTKKRLALDALDIKITRVQGNEIEISGLIGLEGNSEPVYSHRSDSADPCSR